MVKTIEKDNKGTFLYSLRAKRHLTQQQMADILYVSRPTYRLWELDINKMPLGVFLRLVDHFKLTSDDLNEVIHIGVDPPSTEKSPTRIDLEGIKNEIRSIKSFLLNSVDARKTTG